MTFQQALDRIESVDFIARMCVASDLASILHIAAHEEPVVALASHLENDTSCVDRLAEHISCRSRLSPDGNYRNRYDVALAVFLNVLHSVDRQAAWSMAHVVQRAPRCWWALQVAQSMPTSTDTSRDEAA